MAEQVLERVVGAVADGAPVDWSALERELDSGDERRWLECLRVLADIADVHAADDVDDADAMSEDEDDTRAVMTDGLNPAASASKWGRYRLLEKVGEGGFGAVHRAWDSQLEREVAIKILHRRVDDQRLRDGLLREGRALARVRHPNVVSVLGVESHDEQIGLCMEFVHGETLEDSLQSHGALSAREAALVGEDVCRALAAVHLAGFVHRDVKARNVMREKAGRIVLMDFGAGQHADQLKIPGRTSMVGTPLYMAPELLAGQSASACSDVYSVGVLLYRLATGEYPVEGSTLDEIRAAHMQGRRRSLAERRPALSKPFVAVVDRAMSPDPSKRYATAAALLDAIGAVTRPAPTARLRKALTVAVLGFVSIVLVGLLTTVMFNLALGRHAPFDNESPAVWLEMGLRSLVMPPIYMSGMLLVWWTARSAIRLVMRLPACRQWMRRPLDAVARLSTSLKLDEPEPFAQAATMAGVLALAAVIWQFGDVLKACATFTISDASVQELLPLQWDENRVGPARYRVALEVIILGLGGALLRIRTLRRRHGRHRGATLPITAMLVLAVLGAEVPYRLLWRNFAERIDVAGQRCYILGTHENDGLIYCPDRTPPRNQTIDLRSPSVRRVGVFESIFTPALAGSR